MEFVGNSPDLKKALAHPVKPKGGPRAVVGNAGGCRNSHQLCEATAADLAVLGSLREGDPEGRQDRRAAAPGRPLASALRRNHQN
jgi:hypothetical protein